MCVVTTASFAICGAGAHRRSYCTILRCRRVLLQLVNLLDNQLRSLLVNPLDSHLRNPRGLRLLSHPVSLPDNQLRSLLVNPLDSHRVHLRVAQQGWFVVQDSTPMLPL